MNIRVGPSYVWPKSPQCQSSPGTSPPPEFPASPILRPPPLAAGNQTAPTHSPPPAHARPTPPRSRSSGPPNSTRSPTSPQQQHVEIPSAPRGSPFLRLRSTAVCDDGHWVRRLDHKDWLAPNEVLKIFASIRDAALIPTVFKKACARRDHKPSEALYSLMIDRLAGARRFGDVEELLARARVERFRFSDEFFYRLVKMYGNVANHPEKAMETLYAMPGYGCWPSTKTFNYVLHMLVCKRQYEVVHEVYASAPRLGVPLETCCFNILVKGLCQFGKFDEAFSLLDEMPKQECVPNAKTYSTLMHFLCRNGRADEAFELFERMRKEEIEADAVVYNILISGLCREGRVAAAFDRFKSMSSEGCHPNSGTYQVLLDGLQNVCGGEGTCRHDECRRSEA